MVLMDPAGHLKFPQSGKYDNNLDCDWKISAPSGTVSTLRLHGYLPVKCCNMGVYVLSY